MSRLDLLFVVDASPSMAPHLERLRAALPALLEKLRTPIYPHERGSAYDDLHIGVISSDLGAGPSAASGCSADGDDGVLEGRAACGTDGFIWHFEGYHDPAQTSSQLDCTFAQLARSDGRACVLTQPLQAALKALSPSASGSALADGSLGHGDGGNAGFSRGPKASLAVVFVTDRDDCSGLVPTAGESAEALLARCLEQSGLLASLQGYLDAYRGLTPYFSRSAFLLAGVPADLIAIRGDQSFFESAEREAYFTQILADPRMQTPPNGSAAPACMVGSAPVYPPRRLLQFMNASEQNKPHLASLCAEDLAEALYASLASELPWRTSQSSWLELRALPVARNAAGLFPCRMTWELPLEHDPTRPLTPTTCEERPDILSTPGPDFAQRSASGRTLCEVRQVPVFDVTQAPPDSAGPGFYPNLIHRADLWRFITRLFYTPGAAPPEGVNIRLRCLDDAQHQANRKGVLGADLGDPCDYRGLPYSPDDYCDAREGVRLLDRFCHPEKHVCVRGCKSDDECPTNWICDSGTTHLAATAGQPICVNPGCGLP